MDSSYRVAGIGEADIDELMGEARGRLKKKRAELQEALVGWLQPVYRMLLTQHMEQVRLLWKQVEEINHRLSEAMKDHVPALVRLTKIPGIDLYAAQELLAEIGVRALALPSGDQFASWVGVCPWQPGIGGDQLQPPLRQGQPLLKTIAVPDRLGGSPHQEHVFWGIVCALQAQA